MAANLTRFLLETHGAGRPEAGRPVRVSPGHVVLDEDSGVVALLAFEALGGGAVRCPVALVAPDREAAGPDELADQRYLRTAASACGAWFARPGAGPAAALHRRRFAGPGACLASPVQGAAGAGAFGMLVFAASPLECAAVLAGRPLLRAYPPIIGVRVTGMLPAGAGGVEALAALAEGIGRAARGAVLEFHGDGIASLAMADRIAMATLAPRVLGAAASIFPADDEVRDHLSARGRDEDWRRFEGAHEAFDSTLILDLETAATPRAGDAPAVRIGPHAEDDDLRALADALAARTGPPLANVQVVLGGRAMRAALAADGTLERLAGAGVELLVAGDVGAGVPPPEDALACGDEDALDSGATARSATALAALLSGGADVAGRTVAAPGTAALDPAELLPPLTGVTAIERGSGHRVPRPLPGLEGGLRGVVLLRGSGRVTCEELLPWGPRTRAQLGDADALATHWGRGLDPRAAARGLAHGGGFAVTDGEYGVGEPAEAAARATAALGVRAVLAASYGAAHERALVLCGVLPLRWERADDAANVLAGDELELPVLVEVLPAHARVTVRHLTRGLSFGARHALEERDLELVLAGGLLGLALEPERT